MLKESLDSLIVKRKFRIMNTRSARLPSRSLPLRLQVSKLRKRNILKVFHDTPHVQRL